MDSLGCAFGAGLCWKVAQEGGHVCQEDPRALLHMPGIASSRLHQPGTEGAFLGRQPGCAVGDLQFDGRGWFAARRNFWLPVQLCGAGAGGAVGAFKGLDLAGYTVLLLAETFWSNGATGLGFLGNLCVWW